MFVPFGVSIISSRVPATLTIRSVASIVESNWGSKGGCFTKAVMIATPREAYNAASVSNSRCTVRLMMGEYNAPRSIIMAATRLPIHRAIAALDHTGVLILGLGWVQQHFTSGIKNGFSFENPFVLNEQGCL